MLYIVVPTYKREAVCRHFINDLYSQTNQNYHLVLVDHGRNRVDINDTNITLLHSDVNGWARAVNVGLRHVLMVCNKSKDYVLIINDDVILSDNYIQSIYDSIAEKPNAVLGTCCIDQNKNLTLRVAIRLSRLKAKHIYLYQNIAPSKIRDEYIDSDVLTGKGTVFPLSILDKIGIYNEEKLPHYKADHELVWRARKSGFKVYASTKMQLRTLSDQKTASGKERFLSNVRFLYFDMRSTMRIKDLWNYSILAYKFPFSLYFFIMNFLYNNIGIFITYFKTR